ncbi:Lon protease [Symbiodinium microadriaticum]|uniref:endopeptidase La n=1 Tax=Symbiodinium microadriaticum TaxID=2951 RepID=A0A1Q9F210_SYMMI|nr:Lon protease [Symbiodinium microadriaticum]
MASATRTDIFILALRQQVIFPAMRATVTVSQDTFTELCDFCEKNQRTHIACITMRPDGELYSTGTWCRIASHQQSTAKFQDQETTEVPKLVEQVQGAMNEFMHLNLSDKNQEENQSPRRLLPNIFGNSKKARWPASPSVLADMVAAALQQLSIEEKQQVLDTLELPARLELVLKLVKQVNEVLRLSKQMSDKVQRRSSEELRETVLKRQLTDLHREMRRLRLGKEEKLSDSESDEGELQGGLATEEDEEDQVASLREALKKAQLSAEAQKIAQRELRRLQNIQPHHPEHSVCRTYLETLAGLPWALSSQDDLDLNAARDILEKDHHGLEKVKRRILEFLAVQKMRGDMKGPILCLNGPPGVGKTSLGKSVARALNRKFHRIALGGVRDEAEIRGHRRTYIGCWAIMRRPTEPATHTHPPPVNNPVILLDEIDKLTRNAMFNPSGAMLELLDPEQNHTFKDHYINTPFDLSKVLFLCTCNDLNTIDRPLLDRMEVIELAGYTVEEKVHITTTHLLPKQRRISWESRCIVSLQLPSSLDCSSTYVFRFFRFTASSDQE